VGTNHAPSDIGIKLMTSPLDTDMGIDPDRRFDEWEYVLYIMTLAFLIEGESVFGNGGESLTPDSEAIKVYKVYLTASASDLD
jgi:hypothetical protein